MVLEEYEKVLGGHNAFGLNWTFNASLSWDIPYFRKYKTSLTLYAQNLLDYGKNKRYRFYVRNLPIISWQEEPRTVSMKLTVDF